MITKLYKAFLLTAALFAFATLSAFTAFASSDSRIEYVSINMEETRQAPGTVWIAEPTENSDRYDITEVDWNTDYDAWTPGKKTTLTVTLETEESFDSEAKASVSRGEVVSVSRSGSKKLRVKINYIPKVTLEAPSGIYYEDEYTVAWEKVEYAGGYEVRLYKDGNGYKTLKLDGRTNTEIDLSEYATDDSLMTVSIKAVAPSGKSSYIISSEEVMFDGEGVMLDAESTVYGTFTGSGSSKRFQNDYGDGESSTYAQGWQLINGNWYYFNPENYNYAVTDGWFQSGPYWYYFDAEGRMMTGWIKDEAGGGYWYYLNTDPSGEQMPFGAMRTGWIVTAPNSPWYYLNPGPDVVQGLPGGAMLTDTYTPDGYYVNANGEWVQ